MTDETTPRAPTNGQIADAFQLLGDLLQIDGVDRHRVLAYHRGAARVRATPESVAELARAGRATDLPDIGSTLQAKIVELADTGQIAALVKLTDRVPPGLAAIARIEGLGPKRAMAIWQALGVSTIEGLLEAADDGRLPSVPGVGPKLVEAVRAAASVPASGAPRTLLARAREIATPIAQSLAGTPGATRAEVAGSIRRGRETIGDIDIVVATTDPEAAIEAFVHHPLVERVEQRGPSKTTALTHGGVRVELRVGPPASFGNLLQHCTGSAAHNVRLRERAVRDGRSVSEHGILEPDGTLRAHADEAAVYAAFDLPWIPPELREDIGELDGPLPRLVGLDEIRGDLHAHSDWSDGRSTIEQMALAAAARGYAYLAVSDHSHGLAMARGLDLDRARRQWEVIDALNDRGDLGVLLLKGVELEIRTDGRLDFDDEVLASFDVVVASIHSGFRQSSREVTARMLAALDNPHVDILGHPTGRRIGRRAPLEFDAATVFERAAATGTLLEINAQGERMDLSDVLAREARAAGCRFVISSDAHSDTALAGIEIGVLIARRAGLGPDDIANTSPVWPQVSG